MHHSFRSHFDHALSLGTSTPYVIIVFPCGSASDATDLCAPATQITAGVSTLEALIDVRVKDLQWALKAPAEEVHKLLAAAKQQVSTLNADEHAAKEVEEAAIRGNLGLKI